MTVTIDATCTACGLCLATCPPRALRPAPNRPLVVDHRCTDCWLCLEVCPVDAISPHLSESEPPPTAQPLIHPIEAESYRILERRVDLSAWPEPERAVVARVIHATADVDYAASMRIGERAVEAATAALEAGAPVVCDAHMLRVGLTRLEPVCLLDEVGESSCLSPSSRTSDDAGEGAVTAPPATAGVVDARGPGPTTRAAAAIRLAAERHPDGALWVVGNAPTALAELLGLSAAGRVRPAVVVGLPVGFVGAKEAKAELWASDLRDFAITNVGEKGGSAAAAGAVNALVRGTRAGARSS